MSYFVESLLFLILHVGIWRGLQLPSENISPAASKNCLFFNQIIVFFDMSAEEEDDPEAIVSSTCSEAIVSVELKLIKVSPFCHLSDYFYGRDQIKTRMTE